MLTLSRRLLLRGVAAAALSPLLLIATPAARAIDLLNLTAEQVKLDYANGAYTAVQLTQAILDQISRYESVYNAYITINPNALADAAAIDAAMATPGPKSPLFGIPMAIKDAMDVRGLPTTGGSSFLSSLTGGIDLIPDKDSPIVARLREAGVIIIGKTNIPDWSRDGSRSTSTVAGPTRNAYNPARAPGGSSGGSSVAVATGMAILGTAEETGSSITNPASAASLVGIRPTFGLVPSTGVMPGQGTFRDVMGPLAKTVKDAANFLDVIAGPTPDDPKTAAAEGKLPAGGYVGALSDTSLRGARIGVYGPGWNSVPLAPETQALFQAQLDVLVAEGATLVTDPFLGSGYFELTQNLPSSNTFSYDINQYFARYDESLINSVAEFNAASPVDWYDLPLQRAASSEEDPATRTDLDAYRTRREQLRAKFQEVMDLNDLDALVMPQLAAPVPLLNSTTPISRTPGTGVNVMGIPGVVAPGGYYGDGTPFAMYFVGRMWDEAKLIGLAYDYEQATLHRVAPQLVPEPTTLALAAAGPAIALLAARRRLRPAA